jgi:hypothetical protein
MTLTPQIPLEPKEEKWSVPEPALDEKELIKYLSMPLSVEHLQTLLISNVFAVQDAYDRRVLRGYFYDTLVNSANFNNFMNRVATMQEAARALENGTLSTTWLKEKEDDYRACAHRARTAVIGILRMLSECRQPTDPVN